MGRLLRSTQKLTFVVLIFLPFIVLGLVIFFIRLVAQTTKLDDFAVRDIIEERLGRKLECECQVLYDERELRKNALRRQYGVDFESREIGLVD